MSNKTTRRDFLKSTTAVGIAASAVGQLPTGAAAGERRSRAGKEAEVIDIGSRRELFVDDHMIERLSGQATLRLHHPVARELALVHDAAWEGTSCGYQSVFQDGELYRMYYRGSQLQVKDGKLYVNQHKPVTCYAESRDGVHWKKPELGIIEFNGSKKNNIIWDGVGVHNFAPFKDSRADCPAESRYKALGGLRGEGGLFAFQSADALHWSLTRDKPVITNGAFDSQNIGFWDEASGKYRAYWRYFTKGVTTEKVWKPAGIRAIRTASSSDFLNWTDEADLTYVDSPHQQLYTNQIKPYHRAPHILIGLPTHYIDRGWSQSMRDLPERADRESRAKANQRYGTAITEVLLMASRDGKRFKRWNEAFMPPGIEREGTWNYGQHYAAWHIVETPSTIKSAPNELSFYSKEGGWTGTSSQLRRYTLRVDGFVSANAPWKGGELVTKPFQFKGERLSINFATSAASSVRVELQTADGKAIAGYPLQDCDELFGDSLDRAVTWKENGDVGKLAGKTIRLRFALKAADLYSFQFG